MFPRIHVPLHVFSKYRPPNTGFQIQTSKYRLPDTGSEIQASNTDFEIQASEYRLRNTNSLCKYRLEYTSSKYQALAALQAPAACLETAKVGNSNHRERATNRSASRRCISSFYRCFYCLSTGEPTEQQKLSLRALSNILDNKKVMLQGGWRRCMREGIGSVEPRTVRPLGLERASLYICSSVLHDEPVTFYHRLPINHSRQRYVCEYGAGVKKQA